MKKRPLLCHIILRLGVGSKFIFCLYSRSYSSLVPPSDWFLPASYEWLSVHTPFDFNLCSMMSLGIKRPFFVASHYVLWTANLGCCNKTCATPSALLALWIVMVKSKEKCSINYFAVVSLDPPRYMTYNFMGLDLFHLSYRPAIASFELSSSGKKFFQRRCPSWSYPRPHLSTLSDGSTLGHLY